MLGAIIGDIVGSRFEFNNINTKSFDLFTDDCRFTDDTVMTCAVAEVFNQNVSMFSDITSNSIIDTFLEVGRRHPNCGYGRKFFDWMLTDGHQRPYDSFGNGSAMRISPVIAASRSIDHAIDFAQRFSIVSHNHSEGIKGAECVAFAGKLASYEESKQYIMKCVRERYYPDIGTVKQWREYNGKCHGKEICQVSVPAALACFNESRGFEDCIRNCISIGGDSDTIAAIAGGIAEYYYGIPKDFAKEAKKYLSNDLLEIVEKFEDNFEN